MKSPARERPSGAERGSDGRDTRRKSRVDEPPFSARGFAEQRAVATGAAAMPENRCHQPPFYLGSCQSGGKPMSIGLYGQRWCSSFSLPVAEGRSSMPAVRPARVL